MHDLSEVDGGQLVQIGQTLRLHSPGRCLQLLSATDALGIEQAVPGKILWAAFTQDGLVRAARAVEHSQKARDVFVYTWDRRAGTLVATLRTPYPVLPANHQGRAALAVQFHYDYSDHGDSPYSAGPYDRYSERDSTVKITDALDGRVLTTLIPPSNDFTLEHFRRTDKLPIARLLEDRELLSLAKQPWLGGFPRDLADDGRWFVAVRRRETAECNTTNYFQPSWRVCRAQPRLWDTLDGTSRELPLADDRYVRLLKFSRDGSLLVKVTGSWTRSGSWAAIYDSATLELELELSFDARAGVVSQAFFIRKDRCAIFTTEQGRGATVCRTRAQQPSSRARSPTK